MIFCKKTAAQNTFREAISRAYLTDEARLVNELMSAARFSESEKQRIQGNARELVLNVRQLGHQSGALEAFLKEYDLSTNEGIALMCLAEALLRIPDSDTADKLIQDKLSAADWETHLGKSRSLFVNASTWGLMLTGKFVNLNDANRDGLSNFLNKFIYNSSEPAIRLALKQAMRIMAHQFVMGKTIQAALERSREGATEGATNVNKNELYRYSFDMLGEAALCQQDADKYFAAYNQSIDDIVAGSEKKEHTYNNNSISIKLSALHPRYEYSQRDRVLKELVPKVLQLALKSKQGGIGLTIDAEESDRTELSLDVFEQVYAAAELNGWSGLGLVVQAYQKRALPILHWLADLSHKHGRSIPVRLVKGAYWDTEIKRAQESGLLSYPVFTRKVSTDVSYIACAKYLLSWPEKFYAQFATHNAHTVASIFEIATTDTVFEFQRLHGMGESLYKPIVEDFEIPCRVYAPVGSHEDLLPYLVRRLLENGANTSFVNRIEDETIAIEEIIADPVEQLQHYIIKPHTRIPLPVNLYGEVRKNSLGINFHDSIELDALAEQLQTASKQPWRATPLINGVSMGSKRRTHSSPVDHRTISREVIESTNNNIDVAVETASNAAIDWDETSAITRAEILDQAADLIELHRAELIYLCIVEGGKTIADAMAEVREAADFCRYYAQRGLLDFSHAQSLHGPTGESNDYILHGRGVFACISPWNFPVAIFTGQVVAALAAGNTVIAKPARQTPLSAMLIVQLLFKAGIPEAVLQFLPGEGNKIGKKLLIDNRINGFAFTGSIETAWSINRGLALRDGPIVPLIAETGGQNIMIVDSSALPEQVVSDVIHSAFNSAGQRCSALRVLFLQEEIAPRVIDLLKGAMQELNVGNPALLSTDIGPVIDVAAQEKLLAHIGRLSQAGNTVFQLAVDDELKLGTYFAPAMVEIDSINILQKEVFGPILHVVRFQSNKLDEVIKNINAMHYGLTLGIHSRIEERCDYIQRRVRVGNIYVNRNMIGAVVGVQPFGGEGLSGTGPKAGGPNYLTRFAAERTVSINTAAIGGNASLISMLDEER